MNLSLVSICWERVSPEPLMGCDNSKEERPWRAAQQTNAFRAHPIKTSTNSEDGSLFAHGERSAPVGFSATREDAARMSQRLLKGRLLLVGRGVLFPGVAFDQVDQIVRQGLGRDLVVHGM